MTAILMGGLPAERELNVVGVFVECISLFITALLKESCLSGPTIHCQEQKRDFITLRSTLAVLHFLPTGINAHLLMITHNSVFPFCLDLEMKWFSNQCRNMGWMSPNKLKPNLDENEMAVDLGADWCIGRQIVLGGYYSP